jgi:hypothetical protein
MSLCVVLEHSIGRGFDCLSGTRTPTERPMSGKRRLSRVNCGRFAATVRSATAKVCLERLTAAVHTASTLLSFTESLPNFRGRLRFERRATSAIAATPLAMEFTDGDGALLDDNDKRVEMNRCD